MINKYSHSDLVEIGAKWVKKVKRFPIVAKEMKCSGSREQPDVIAFTSNSSLMIECKTSISDFKADFKKPERIGVLNAIGNYRLYLAPKGLIGVDLIPEKWGLLEVDEAGVVEEVKFKIGNIYFGNSSRPIDQADDIFFHLSDMNKERSFLYSILRRG